MRTETTLRDYHDALRAKGTSAKDAKVALARKIASLTLNLLKKQRYIQRRLRGVFKGKKTTTITCRTEKTLKNLVHLISHGSELGDSSLSYSL
ncbi:MAG: hypothetical protein HOP07_18305 [Bacteriovoracaceae bacterium]|nr:hypothetical protein [Bacteriovoracaceae bacterium]